MLVIADERTPEQQETHKWLVVMTDAFMSGWGKAKGTTSYAAWACESQEVADYVFKQVQERTDSRRVRIVYEGNKKYKPRKGHLAIYVCGENHRYYPGFKHKG